MTRTRSYKSSECEAIKMLTRLQHPFQLLRRQRAWGRQGRVCWVICTIMVFCSRLWPFVAKCPQSSSIDHLPLDMTIPFTTVANYECFPFVQALIVLVQWLKMLLLVNESRSPSVRMAGVEVVRDTDPQRACQKRVMTRSQRVVRSSEHGILLPACLLTSYSV